jgi:hypothetical protein
MSLFDDEPRDDTTRPDPRERPEDPIGTKPRHDPEALLPHEREPLLGTRTGASQERARDEPEATPEELATEAAPELSGAGAHPPHAARFQFVYGVLIGVAIAALTAAVLAFSGHNSHQQLALSNWSAWHPTAGAGDPIQQIVDHVAPEYRLASGHQAVAVTVLLRREALEMALYTFNYVKDIDAVTVLFPPAMDPKTHKLSHISLFFRPQDVQPSLQNPLVDTLPGPTPNMRNLMRSKNLPVIDSITRPLQFDFSVTQDNTNNRGYLVLDTPKP